MTRSTGGTTGRTTAAACAGLQEVATRHGFRRVEHIRITFGADGPRAHVVGVVHRYPWRFRVPLHVAADLLAAGAPLVVQDASRRDTPATR